MGYESVQTIPRFSNFNAGVIGMRYEKIDSKNPVISVTTRFPSQYRLCKKSNGELILQGEFFVSGIKDGIKFGGCEWKDIKTVEENNNG